MSKDFGAPRMPFVIGVMGFGGKSPDEGNAAFREAMAAPAALREFYGNVIAVRAAPFWDEPLGAIHAKYELKTKNKKHANADGTMTVEQQREYL